MALCSRQGRPVYATLVLWAGIWGAVNMSPTMLRRLGSSALLAPARHHARGRKRRAARPHPQRRKVMSWTTPKVIEISVGMEINSYACADL
ncbi:pyrroloquinoline quinone precursor peptide PqqA [Pelagibius marinus]|uniref:pyrroloquinoline quinone precursor peptide PqqA n=1 Tax=Pelagibius marinus TaxID=2762760 RepID=UPI0029CA074C